VERAKAVGVGGKAWFVEDDRTGRRLALHARAAGEQVNLSLWDGAVCQGTFRLPVSEIPRLVYELIAALGAAAGSARIEPTGGPADSGALRLVPDDEA
jgi:hypothetical protein